MALRDNALSFQVPAAELPALQAILAALERNGAHLGVLSTSGEALSLSPALEAGLRDLLRLLSSRHAVEVMPADAELSPNEAADHLGVSRTFVNKLLDRGELPYRLVGAHKRIPLADLLGYKARTAARRDEGLAAIAGFSQLQGGESDAPYPR